MTYRFSEELLERVVKKNKNALVCISGATGSGKSYAALSEAETIDPEFNIDRVVFGLDDFMKLLNSGTLKKGSCLILDELGVLAPSREWYSLSNKVFNYVLQTFRSDNLIVFFCVPDLSFVDSQTRKLFHYIIEPIKINRETNVSTLKVMRIEPNVKTGEVYYKYPRYSEGGEIIAVTEVLCDIPSVKLRHAYEKKKEDFKRKLYANIMTDLETVKQKTEVRRGYNKQQIITTIMTNPKFFERTYGGRTYIDASLIKTTFNIGRDTANGIRSEVEKLLYHGDSRFDVKVEKAEPIKATEG